jgi:hypothetical protein
MLLVIEQFGGSGWIFTAGQGLMSARLLSWYYSTLYWKPTSRILHKTGLHLKQNRGKIKKIFSFFIFTIAQSDIIFDRHLLNT